MLATDPTVVHVFSSGTDWASIAATFATFAAAIFGIGGTVYVSERARAASSKDLEKSLRASTENLQKGINAEDQRALRAEKLCIYASYIAAIDTGENAIIDLSSRLHSRGETATVERVESAGDR